MEAKERRYHASIPADYTNSPYPLQYFFALRDASGRAWFHPGFDEHLCNQPYFVVRQARRSGRHAVGVENRRGTGGRQRTVRCQERSSGSPTRRKSRRQRIQERSI